MKVAKLLGTKVIVPQTTFFTTEYCQEIGLGGGCGLTYGLGDKVYKTNYFIESQKYFNAWFPSVQSLCYCSLSDAPR